MKWLTNGLVLQPGTTGKNEDVMMLAHWKMKSIAEHALVNLPKEAPKQDINIVKREKNYQIALTLKNDSDKLSFFNHLMIMRNEIREILYPVFGSDNFISLFTHETKTVTAARAMENLKVEKPY